MDNVSDKFDLHATLEAVGQAAIAVVCHMLFDFAVHGLFMALILAVAGFSLRESSHRFGVPLLAVSRRIAIFCAVLALPGTLCLAIYGHLPPAGVFNFNSIGFISLWSLICVHLSAEEINHRQSSL